MIFDNLAIVFPGQGSQFVGMGKDFYDKYEKVKQNFELMNLINNKSIIDIIFDGSEDDLKETDIAQQAIYTLSSSIYEILENNKIIPKYVAGHSLGEYSAIFASGLLDFEVALKLVRKRGLFIKEASEKNFGGMIAILGLEGERVLKLVSSLKDEKIEVEIANYNSSMQIVLSYKGNKLILEKIINYFLKNGAKRVIELKVSGPFHSSFMDSASEKLKIELENIKFNIQNIPIVFNYNAKVQKDIIDIKKCIVYQLNHSVLWVDIIKFLISHRIDTILEVGPGKVLTGLNKKIDNTLKLYNIESIRDLEFFLENFKK